VTTVAVLGAGGGGCAATVDLSLAGHRVHLWNRGTDAIARVHDGLHYTGVLGEGTITPLRITTDLDHAIAGAEVAVICLPALAHEALLAELARLRSGLPLVLNPGHTGGALHARAQFMSQRGTVPPIAELSTLTYVARKLEPNHVAIYGKAGRVRTACLPGGIDALDLTIALFPAAAPVGDVLATGLANVNLVLHPPGAVLGAAWVEATDGDFTFYVDGMTPGVARTVAALDDERLAVADAFGHALPPLAEEMAALGTIGPGQRSGADIRTLIRTSTANAKIKAPESFRHRYYQEDFAYGLVPFITLARLANVPVPIAQALLRLGMVMTGDQFDQTGLTAERLDIVGLDRSQLLRLVGR
jgi:opine dehydrogenase